MTDFSAARNYSTFGVRQSIRQLLHAVRQRRVADQEMSRLFLSLQEHEALIARHLGRPVEHLRILEIGPGQGRERSRYFGIRNDVVAMDSDVLAHGFDPAGYLRMLRENGFGRLAKTVGRAVVIGRKNRAAWAKTVATTGMREPLAVHGDICAVMPGTDAFDVVMSWSVMEHVADPRTAVRHMVQALRPGGVLFISLHLYTSHNGHHDIRAFTGHEDALPLWGHLRASTRHLVFPSARLNRWRLPEWRALFSQMIPGCLERLEAYDTRARFGPLIDGALRDELREYADEELFTVDAIYVWKKPS